MLHGLWPTASTMEKRNQGRSDICIRCHQAAETVAHVYQCQHRLSKASFREALQIFQKSLSKRKTPKPLQNMFKEFFIAYHEKRPARPPVYKFGNFECYTLLKRAYDHQMLLKSPVFHLRYISYKWAKVHQKYMKSTRTEQSSDVKYSSWPTFLIKAIWKFSNSLWTKRCATIHKKDKFADGSLFTEELRSSIRTYLRLPRNQLSSNEKILHLNVSRQMRNAYPTTLARWL